MKKNYKAKLLGAIAALGLAVASTVGSTYAWFSANKSVTATGMQVKATTASSLVIADSASNLAQRKVTVGLTGQDTAIAPSTLNWTAYTTTGLGYVTNPQDVDPATGLAKDGSTLNIVDVNGDTSSTSYYLDYEVYIASSGAAMDAGLEVKLANITTADDTLEQAFTVAFYVGSVASGNLKGTLRFNQTSASDKVTLVEKATGAIPELASNNIHVIMRVFLDGAYEETSGTANVNNGTVSTDSITFSAAFAAVE